MVGGMVLVVLVGGGVSGGLIYPNIYGRRAWC